MKSIALASTIVGLLTVGFLGGCAVYRDATLQGAADVGTVIGSAVGVPLGVVAVSIDESFDSMRATLRKPRLYQRTASANDGGTKTASVVKVPTASHKTTPIVIYDENIDYYPVNAWKDAAQPVARKGRVPVELRYASAVRSAPNVAPQMLSTSSNSDAAKSFWLAR